MLQQGKQISENSISNRFKDRRGRSSRCRGKRGGSFREGKSLCWVCHRPGNLSRDKRTAQEIQDTFKKGKSAQAFIAESDLPATAAAEILQSEVDHDDNLEASQADDENEDHVDYDQEDEYPVSDVNLSFS